MSPRLQRLMTETMDSSAVIGFVRTVVAGSVLCAAGRWALERARTGRERVIVGLGGHAAADEASQMSRRAHTIVSGSRLARFVEGGRQRLFAAARTSAAARAIAGPLAHDDAESSVRAIGGVLIVATVTHALLMPAVGVPVSTAGWLFRAGVVLAGAVLMSKPQPLARAWSEKSQKSIT